MLGGVGLWLGQGFLEEHSMDCKCVFQTVKLCVVVSDRLFWGFFAKASWNWLAPSASAGNFMNTAPECACNMFFNLAVELPGNY